MDYFDLFTVLVFTSYYGNTCMSNTFDFDLYQRPIYHLYFVELCYVKLFLSHCSSRLKYSLEIFFFAVCIPIKRKFTFLRHDTRYLRPFSDDISDSENHYHLIKTEN